MKSIVKVVAIVAIALCSALLTSPHYMAHAFPRGDRSITLFPTAAAADAEPVAAFALPALETDKSRSVEFAIDVGALDTFTARERTDQYRDWLLYAAAATLEPSAARLNEMFFDLPTTRLPHLRAFGTFEYGVTRSRLLADGRVIALVPADVSGNARKDLFAEIADEQQKNMGGRFDRLLVFDYRIDEKAATGELTRRADVGYDTLYSAEYGYHERRVSTLAELKQLMATIEDLVSVSKRDDGLMLGGRKLLSRKYRSIGIEHIATLWQSKTAEDSGFSLDPAYDFEKLSKSFDDFVAAFGTEVGVEKTELTQVGDALRRRNAGPLLALIKRSEDKDILLSLGLALLEDDAARQTARYDGNTKGTEVGMILFYTDLLAKLWTIDLDESSPRRNKIPDFVDDPSIRLSPIYDAEIREFDSARIWLGNSVEGFQMAPDRHRMLFARNTTRLFSAGRDSADSSTEVEASAFMAAAIDWWNDHYSEVAREETEYERLNEIMKWSLVISWLRSSSQTWPLDFLDEVNVDRSMNFPAWVKRHPELRFSAWDEVPIHINSEGIETLPRLYGPVTAGGVSLASAKDVLHAPLASAVSPSVRRSGRDYAKTDAQRPEARDGTRYELRNTSDARAELRTESRPTAKLRSLLSQLARFPVLRTMFAAKDRLSLETRVGDVSLGTLRVDAEGSALRVTWQSRDLLVADRLARTLSEKDGANTALLDSPLVDKVIVVGKDSYARLTDSGNWIQFSPETARSVDIPAGWLLRAGQPDAAQSYLARTASAAEVAAEQVGAARVTVSLADGGRVLIQPRADASPTAGATLLLTLGTSQVVARLIDAASTIELSKPDDRAAAQSIVLLALRIGAGQHRLITEALRRGEKNLDLRDNASNALQNALLGADVRGSVATLARDLAQARATFDAQLKRDLDAVVEVRTKLGLGPAMNRLDVLAARYGDLPQFHLLRTLLLVQARRYDRASDALAREKNLAELDQARWFEELAAQRVELDPHDHAELRRYFQLKQAFAAKGDGRVFTRSDGTRLHVEVELTDPTLSQPLSPADVGAIPMQNARFYATGETGLRSTVSGATRSGSLVGLVMGNRIDVRQMTDGRIGEHSPAAIHVTPATSSPPAPGKPPSPASVRFVPIGPHYDTPCTDNPPEGSHAGELGCPVYLVTERLAAQPPVTPSAGGRP